MSKNERDEIIMTLFLRKNYAIEFLDIQPDEVLVKLLAESEGMLKHEI